MTGFSQSGTTHDPRISLETRFLSHIRRRELMVPRHRISGSVLHFAMKVAADEVEWIPASGRATLYSFTVFRQTYRPDMPAPYNVAWVELEEGPRLVSMVRIELLSELRAGMSLVACFTDQGMLVFDPCVTQEVRAQHSESGAKHS